MAALTVRSIVDTGDNSWTGQSASSSDTYTWSPNTVLLVRNDSAGGDTTIAVTAGITTADIPGLGRVTKASISQVVSDGEIAVIDTRSRAFQGSTGVVTVTATETTGLYYEPIRLSAI